MVDNKIMCHFGGEHLATMQRIINNKLTSNQLKCCICQNQKGYPDSKTDMKITIKIDRDPVSGNLSYLSPFTATCSLPVHAFSTNIELCSPLTHRYFCHKVKHFHVLPPFLCYLFPSLFGVVLPLPCYPFCVIFFFPHLI